MLSNFSINVAPCYDYMSSDDDFKYMREIGLPEEWITLITSKNFKAGWNCTQQYFWMPDDWFLDTPKSVIAKNREKQGAVSIH